MESMENVVNICGKCVEERKANMQQGIEEKMLELKDKLDKGYDKGYKIWFKIKLTSGNINEHVWISVIDINIKDSTFYGTIDNDIFCVPDKYSYGDNIAANFNEIEDITEEGNCL